MDKQIDEVIKWAEERGIFDSSDPKSQCLKFLSEAGEVADEINKGTYAKNQNAAMEIGDAYVTLILLGEMIGETPESCISLALSKIQKRTGRMENGVFVHGGDK